MFSRALKALTAPVLVALAGYYPTPAGPGLGRGAPPRMPRARAATLTPRDVERIEAAKARRARRAPRRIADALGRRPAG